MRDGCNIRHSDPALPAIPLFGGLTMDNFIKVTTGHVVQYYGKNQDGIFVCTGQEFFCTDLCDYEDGAGNPIDPPKYKYQPYDMVQPRQDSNENKTFCEACRRHDCTDVKWREQTEQYECEECYQAWLDS